MAILHSIISFLLLVIYSRADIATNCTMEETLGVWVMEMGVDGHTNHIDCSKPFRVVQELAVKLSSPNIASASDGSNGTWTMIYNQGFAIRLGGKHYFAFQLVKIEDKKSISYCDRTFGGWVHNEVENNEFPPKNWSCYKGRKIDSDGNGKENLIQNQDDFGGKDVKSDEEFVAEINSAQHSWQATVYNEIDGVPFSEYILKSGRATWKDAFNTHSKGPSSNTIESISKLPTSFDWRDVQGVNYISPIRNQERCGSCYAFGSMAMLEARIRVRTNNTRKPVFSTQDVVACSQYSQGCEGGFPYLVAGKYALDFGVTEEVCYPYKGKDEKCHPNRPGCARTHVSDYGYVGGFYGACTEDAMLLALTKYGPLSISFEVYKDFVGYKSGIYHHTGKGDHLGHFEMTNHCVLLVGYGEDESTGEKFWTVKNSWGTGWGEEGYFRIRRGTDECAIESMAVWAEPFLAATL